VSAAGRAWSRAGLVLGLVLVLDQITKKLVQHNIAVGEEDSVFPAVTLVHVKNKGVAFSAFEDQVAVVVIVIAIAVLALLAYFARHSTRPLMWLPTGLLAGGALGNIFDRVRDGAVTDFVKLPAWPAFNVADVAITFGVLALLLVLERDHDDEEDDGIAPDRAA
jgi:signal peptidase II